MQLRKRRTKGEFHESFLTYHNNLKNKTKTVKNKQEKTNIKLFESNDLDNNEDIFLRILIKIQLITMLLTRVYLWKQLIMVIVKMVTKKKLQY